MTPPNSLTLPEVNSPLPVGSKVRFPRQYRIVALPGEGIGPEVVDASLQILSAIAKWAGFGLTIDHALIGAPAQDQTGSALPPATLACCEGADGIVFGAVTQSGLLPLRQHFDFFANLRPVRPSKSLYAASPIKPELLEGVDLLFVRELVSGLYFGDSGRSQDEQGDYGFHTMRYSDRDIRRIARVALAQAQNRRQHLVLAHKENALPHLPWRELVRAEARDFPQVHVEPMLVDNLAMQLILRPQEFDVILAGNLFGDILSDLGGAIAGSIGLLGSASLNADGFGLYESIGGTAPDIAGKGIANPLGTLAGIILMLQQWGEPSAAQRLLTVQEQILAQGYRTADLYHPGTQPGTISQHQRPVTTDELVKLFVTEIHKTPR
ncbi:MAG: 3-isopropylmalate dehydrogenase [Cyanobacteria bacterium J06634_5]